MHGSHIPSGVLLEGNRQPTEAEHDRHRTSAIPQAARRWLSRRQFLRTAVGSAGVAVGAGWLLVPRAFAGGSDPQPLPGGVHLPFVPEVPIFHLYPPGPLNEVSVITDFNGHVALAQLGGTSTGIDTDTGAEKELNFVADMRFMQGQFVRVDGGLDQGTFGFL